MICQLSELPKPYVCIAGVVKHFHGWCCKMFATPAFHQRRQLLFLDTFCNTRNAKMRFLFLCTHQELGRNACTMASITTYELKIQQAIRWSRCWPHGYCGRNLAFSFRISWSTFSKGNVFSSGKKQVEIQETQQEMAIHHHNPLSWNKPPSFHGWEKTETKWKSIYWL